MSVKSYPKASTAQLSEHFQAFEFDCPCDQCSYTFIDEDLVRRLEQMRGLMAAGLSINSGYRCDHYQEALKERGYETAVGRSQHQDGKAADVRSRDVDGFTLETFARRAGFTSVGVGAHFVHVDTRAGDRRWSYAR